MTQTRETSIFIYEPCIHQPLEIWLAMPLALIYLIKEYNYHYVFVEKNRIWKTDLKWNGFVHNGELYFFPPYSFRGCDISRSTFTPHVKLSDFVSWTTMPHRYQLTKEQPFIKDKGASCIQQLYALAYSLQGVNANVIGTTWLIKVTKTYRNVPHTCCKNKGGHCAYKYVVHCVDEHMLYHLTKINDYFKKSTSKSITL